MSISFAQACPRATGRGVKLNLGPFGWDIDGYLTAMLCWGELRGNFPLRTWLTQYTILSFVSQPAAGSLIRLPDIRQDVRDALRDNKKVEEALIRNTLRENYGDQSATARHLEELDIDRSTLRRRIKKYGIDPKEYKPAK